MKAQNLAVLPLRDIVVFPNMVAPLFVGREKSVAALEHAMSHGSKILLVAQQDPEQNEPGADNIYSVGTVASILQMLKLPDGTVKVLVEGGERMAIDHFVENKDFFEASAHAIVSKEEKNPETEGLMRACVKQFEAYCKHNKRVQQEVLASAMQTESPGELADLVAAHINVKLERKQALLETLNSKERLKLILESIDDELSVIKVEQKIKSRVKKQMEKTQRDYYLNEQMKAIQRELGDSDEAANEIKEVEEKIKATKLSKEAREKAQSELSKLKQMSPMSAESTMVRNYLDWLLSIPWSKKRRLKKDLHAAEKQLDSDHYGLEKVKDRILEYLAVHNRTKKMKGPILCLVGPPGVGKTSLGKSIAAATGRDFVRVALGGVRDEAEIRGHRRTYIGSMPGKVIQSMKKAKSSNPLFLLDEVDKMGADFRGDPASALLEVLDPEQNNSFGDHYLEVDYDLSDVMFVTTANSLDMAQPLLDRMEIIRIAGYTEDEKVEIARRHLIPKLLKNHGLKKAEWQINDAALRDLIRTYTQEAGVRNLEREIAGLMRKAVRQIESGEAKKIIVTLKNIEKFAGIRKYRFGLKEGKNQIGVVTGLAWTQFGGDLLTIEAVQMTGSGKMTVTGNLKDVMKESISAAASYVQSRAPLFGVKPTLFKKTDIHVHVPEGATPKDGPSAGIAMVAAIVSVLTGIPVSNQVAMTGEVTLRGTVLPIGGLKEKLLAALRGGVTTVLIPSENEKDLAEIPDKVKKALKIVPVNSVDEVLRHALIRPLEPIIWEAESEPGSDVATKLTANVPSSDPASPLLSEH